MLSVWIDFGLEVCGQDAGSLANGQNNSKNNSTFKLSVN